MATALKWNGATALAAVRREAAWRLNAAGAAVVARARQLAPVRTGAFRDGISYTFHASTLTLIIYAEAPHSAFVEFGTSRMAARPTIRPALAEASRVLGDSSATPATLRFAGTSSTYAAGMAAQHGSATPGVRATFGR